MKRGGGKHATIWTWSLVRLQGQCMIEIFYKRTSSSAQGAHNLFFCKIKNRRLITYYKNTR